jgi:hypothetical protein
MAKTYLSVDKRLDHIITGFNDLVDIIGDKALLNTSVDSDIVGAINSLYVLVDSALDFRNKISATDAGGDGSLSYSSATGIITYTGPSASEVRTHLSATTYGSGDGSFSYNSATGNFTYTGPSATEVRSHFSAGEGIDFEMTGVISGEDATTTNKGISSFDSAGFTVTSGAVSIKTGGVTEVKLGAAAVTVDKIGTGAVTAAKLGTGAVTVDKIGAAAVTEVKLGTGAVTAAKLGTAAVTVDKIGTGAVTEVKLGDDAVSRAKLKDEVSLVIYNSSGTALKTLYAAGS